MACYLAGRGKARMMKSYIFNFFTCTFFYFKGQKTKQWEMWTSWLLMIFKPSTLILWKPEQKRQSRPSQYTCDYNLSSCFNVSKKMKRPTTVRKQPRQPCRGLDKSAPSKPTLETLQRRSSWSDKKLKDCHTNQIWKKKTKEGAGKTDWKQSQSKKGNSKVIEEIWLDSMVQWVHSF